MRSLWTVSVLCLIVAAGCKSANQPTAKEKATAQWYSARAAVQLSLANDQLKAGNLEKARKSADEALKLDPKNPAVYIFSAKISIEQGKLERAEKELAAARSLDPRNAEADYLSGVIHQRWQQPDRAYSYYEQASEKAPAEVAYLLAKAEMLVLLGREDEALAQLQEKVVYFEHSAAIRDAVGQLLMTKGQHAKAAESFRQASILASDDNSLKEHLALALYESAQYQEAADVLKRLVAIQPYDQRADLLTMLAECQLQIGQAREARDSFDAASRVEPGSASIWLGLAKAAMQIDDTRRAELSIRKALSLEPRSGDGYVMLGYLRLRQNRLTDALSAFQKANALDPSDTVSLCMIGYTLERLGYADQAMDHYGRALQIEPKDELARKLMAGVNPAE